MSEMNGGDGKKKKKDDDGDRSVHSLSSSQFQSRRGIRRRSSQRQRQRCRSDLFSSPAAASATAFAESKAALRRRARVRRQALMVVAGRRLPGEQRPAGVHPAGHRSLLVVVVVVPLIATARGSVVGQRRGALSRSTRTYTSAYRQAGPRSESCLRMDRSLVHAVDRRRTDSPRWWVSGSRA